MGLHQTARRQIASLLDPIGPQHEVARKKQGGRELIFLEMRDCTQVE